MTFDATKHLSEASIRRRAQERQKLQELELQREEQKRREREAEERRRAEERWARGGAVVGAWVLGRGRGHFQPKARDTYGWSRHFLCGGAGTGSDWAESRAWTLTSGGWGRGHG